MKHTVALSTVLAVVLIALGTPVLAQTEITLVANAGPDQTLSAGATCTAQATLNGSASADTDGDALTYTWTGDFTGGTATGVTASVTLSLGLHTITLTVDDGHANTATDTVLITVKDASAPVLTGCLANSSAQCDGTLPPISVTATDNCNGPLAVTVTQTETNPGSACQNTITRTYSATDGSGNTSSCTEIITINDTTPPVISSVTANPSVLWPPDHKFVAVTVTVAATDNCDAHPTSKIISVTSNQADNAKGSGNTTPDFVITSNLTVNVRAERAGPDKGGRIYTITVQSTDDCGNQSATSTVLVTVPHDQGKHGH